MSTIAGSNKLISAGLIVIMGCCMLAGCGLWSLPQQPGPGQPYATITDSLDRTVVIQSRPERIACLYAFSGHVAAMLGAQERIVAVVEGLKRDRILTYMCPDISGLPAPSSEGSINIEELMSCQPDIVFVKNSTAANSGEAAKLDKAGLRYVAVDYRDMQEQINTVLLMGEALGAQDKAQQYAAFYREQIELVRSRTADIPQETRTRVYHSVNEASRTDAPGTLPADWLDACGANNVSVEQELKILENKYYASIEQIYLWNPQIIIVNEPGVRDYILGNPQWQGLEAVAQGRVYQMPVGLSRWGHPGSVETPLALVWTAKLLYPDRFTDIDMIKMTRGFYRDFFGLELDDAQISSILSGRGMRLSREEAGQREEN